MNGFLLVRTCLSPGRSIGSKEVDELVENDWRVTQNILSHCVCICVCVYACVYVCVRVCVRQLVESDGRITHSLLPHCHIARAVCFDFDEKTSM